MNIYSGSREGRGLAAALTNPTEISLRKGTIKQPYPVVIYGHSFPDAETAYFALVKQHGAEGQVTTSDQIMVQVITAKFAKTERFQKWEGVGRQSRFIRNLIAGYESAILPPA